MEKQHFILQKEISDRLTEAARKAFLASMELKRFDAGNRIIRRGDKGDKLYILQEGSCNVNVEKESETYQETNQIVSLKPGDLFGEMALVTGEPRIANVDAETDVTVLEIGAERFDDLCDSHLSFRDILTNVVQNKIYASIFREEGEFGKYNIKDILGKGKLSTVYKGVHRPLNKFVAIKVLKHNLAMDQYFNSYFKDDVRKIVRLNHDNIVKVYDITHLYRTVFLFMEYIEGDSLKQVLDRMPQQPLNRVINILKQICQGLAYAHEQGLLHRSLKPSNILILPNDQVKLVDFGLAYPKVASCAPDDRDEQYMSPEQVEGAPHDERTDIYSLGITAYEMFTGQRLSPEISIHASMGKSGDHKIRHPEKIRADIPGEIRQIVMKATQKDPEKRYRTVQEILEIISPLIGRKDILDYKKIDG